MKRKDLIAKVERTGCEVEIDLYDGMHQTVIITAPQGKNFGGQHTLVNSWFEGSGAGKLYAAAYQDFLNQSEPEECTEENCGSWIDGKCDFWDCSQSE